MRFTLRSLLHSALIAFLALTAASAATPAARFELRDGDRVVFLGETLIEREQYHGWIELMLGQPNGVWLWGLGSGGEHRPLFRQLLVCAFHAKSRAVATRPDGGPTAPVILAASRECIP